jgi:hypothetical protein
LRNSLRAVPEIVKKEALETSHVWEVYAVGSRRQFYPLAKSTSIRFEGESSSEGACTKVESYLGFD